MSELSLVSVRAIVMTYDDTSGKWHPSGTSSGFSAVQIYQHVATNAFRIVGRKLQDQEVVLNCSITRGLRYNAATELFHQWRDNGTVIYGLNFRTRIDADNFHATIDRIKGVLDGVISPQIPVVPQPPVVTQQQAPLHHPQQQQQHQQQHQQQPQQLQGPPMQQMHLQQQQHHQHSQPQQLQGPPMQQMHLQQQQQQQQQQQLHQQQLQQQQQQQLQQQHSQQPPQLKGPPIQQMQQMHMQPQQQQHPPPQQVQGSPASPPPMPQVIKQEHHQPQSSQEANPPQSVAPSVVPQPPPPPPPPPAPLPVGQLNGKINNHQINNLNPGTNETMPGAMSISGGQTNNQTSAAISGPQLSIAIANCRLRKTNYSRSDSEKDPEYAKNSRAGSVSGPPSGDPRQPLVDDLNRAFAKFRKGESQDGDTQSLNDKKSREKLNGSVDHNEVLVDLLRKEFAKFKIELIDAIKAEITDAIRLELNRR